MSALAGMLGQRVTLLVRGPDGGWSDGVVLWAGIRPEPAASGDDAGALPRFAVTLRVGTAAATAERLRWRDTTLRVRRVEADPAAPDRILLRTEAVR